MLEGSEVVVEGSGSGYGGVRGVVLEGSEVVVERSGSGYGGVRWRGQGVVGDGRNGVVVEESGRGSDGEIKGWSGR